MEDRTKNRDRPFDLHDVVAVFHTSFHPTKGNVLDWVVRPEQPDVAVHKEDVDLTNIEFSALPSGVHTVERDVIYFTLPGSASPSSSSSASGSTVSSPGSSSTRNAPVFPALSLFRRRASSAPGARGVRLSALGVVLRPGVEGWRYVAWLEAMWADEHSLELEASVRRVLDDKLQHGHDGQDEKDHPTTHLPTLFPRLGPAMLTVLKHALGGRRVLFFAKPPVEMACVLCEVVAVLAASPETEKPAVLGLVGLTDFGRLSEGGSGWIACTTDALFLEKPASWDLLVDMTGEKDSGVSMWVPSAETTTVKTRTAPTWSDTRVWNELVGGGGSGGVWYEDLCALWFAILFRGGGTGNVRLGGGEQDDDESSEALDAVRKVGAGIEGGPVSRASTSSMAPLLPMGARRRTPSPNPNASPSFSSPSTASTSSSSGTSTLMKNTTSISNPDTEAILAHIRRTTARHLAVLRELVAASSPSTDAPDQVQSQSQSETQLQPRTRSQSQSQSQRPRAQSQDDGAPLVTVTPRDLLAMGLGAWSAGDARYVEWLGASGRLLVEEDESNPDVNLARGLARGLDLGVGDSPRGVDADLLGLGDGESGVLGAVVGRGIEGVPISPKGLERGRGKRVDIRVRRGWRDVLGVVVGYP